MTELTHAVRFLQAAFTILLSLSFGEGFKQLVPDGDQDMRWDRFWSLFALIVMIFPFFHGMNRHFYRTYLFHPSTQLASVDGRLMFDGIMFMIMSAMFFVMSRSLTPNHWTRFFVALVFLLVVDTIWAAASIWLGISDLWPFIWLNLFLGVALVIISIWFRNAPLEAKKNKFSWGPTFYCAIACTAATIADYAWMQNFFFSK